MHYPDFWIQKAFLLYICGTFLYDKGSREQNDIALLPGAFLKEGQTVLLIRLFTKNALPHTLHRDVDSRITSSGSILTFSVTH